MDMTELAWLTPRKNIEDMLNKAGAERSELDVAETLLDLFEAQTQDGVRIGFRNGWSGWVVRRGIYVMLAAVCPPGALWTDRDHVPAAEFWARSWPADWWTANKIDMARRGISRGDRRQLSPAEASHCTGILQNSRGRCVLAAIEDWKGDEITRVRLHPEKASVAADSVGVRAWWTVSWNRDGAAELFELGKTEWANWRLLNMHIGLRQKKAEKEGRAGIEQAK